MNKIFIALGAAAAIAVAGCAADTSDSTADESQGNPAEQTGQASDAANGEYGVKGDAEILAVNRAYNRGEVRTSKIMEKIAVNAEVKAFAQRMVEQHGAVLKEEKDLAAKINVKFQSSPASQQVLHITKAQVKALDASMAKHKNADRKYMHFAVMDHQTLLSELDNELIKSAKNPQLKSFLKAERGAVKAHLEQAKAILAKL